MAKNIIYDQLMKKKKQEKKPVLQPAVMSTGMQGLKENAILEQKKIVGPTLKKEGQKLAAENNWTQHQGLATARAIAVGNTSATQPPKTAQQNNPTQQPLQQSQGAQPETNNASLDTGDFTSITDQAKAMLNEGRQSQRDMETDLFGEAFTPATQDEEVKLFLDKQEEEKTALQKQIEQMNQIDQSEFNMSKKEANSAMDAATAQFAQGREGPMSAGNPLISKQFSQKTTEKIQNTETRLQMRFKEREQILKSLDEAQKQGKQDLAAKIGEELASAENKIRQEQLRIAELADQARTQAFDFLEKAPAGALAGMDPAMVSSSLNVDPMTASLLIQMDTKKMALEERQFEMDEIEYATKVADLEIKMQNAKYAGMTEDMKNFEHYKNLVDVDPQSAEEFALATGIKEKSFFSDFQEEWGQMSAQRDNIFNQVGVKAPIKSKYAYDFNDDGISFERSAPAGTKLTTRGECGQFVNDIINGGPGLFGDTYEQKMSKVNSDFAVPGAAFVEKIGGVTGHVGIVEKVYPDGSFDIRESNYVSRHTVSTAHIAVGSQRWGTIVEQGGFYVPGGTEIKSAQSRSESNGGSALQDFAQQFANGDLTVSDLKDMGMSKGDIAMVTRAAQGLPRGGLQENYMTYAQAIADGNMEVGDLKSFGIKGKDIGMIAAASQEMKSMGGGKASQARTTAEIILGSGGTMSLKDIPEKDRAAVQAEINNLKNNPEYQDNGKSAAQKAAEAIFRSGNTLSISQIPQDLRVDVEIELGRMRDQALKSGDIYGVIRASAGGKTMSDTSMQKFEKTANVINQLQGLTQTLKDKKALKAVGVDSSPFWGWVQGKNPWSKDGQEISAQLQAIVPNLARGVYGEVGVLTNQDVELYRKTLPNLKQPEDIQKSITTLTLRSLRNSMENQIKIQAGSGVDISGLLSFYGEIDQTVNQMESELGIRTSDSKNSGPSLSGTLSGLSALSAPFLGNKIIKPNTQTQQSNPFDDIDLDDPNDFLNNF